MPIVGIFGDQLAPHGETLSAPVAEEETALVPEEVEEQGADFEPHPDIAGETLTGPVTDPSIEQNLAQAEADAEAEAEENESDESESDEGASDSNESDGGSDDGEEHLKAKEVIAKIEEAESVEEVEALAEGDERKTVQEAAEKRKSELE